MYVIKRFQFYVNDSHNKDSETETWYADRAAVRVKYGDYAAFDELDKLLRTKVTRLTFKYELNRFDRDDLVQDLMFHAFMLCFTYDYEKGHYMNYCLYSLRRKAYSKIVNFVELKNLEVMPEDFYMVDWSNALSHIILKEAGIEYSTALSSLSKLEKLILSMFIELRSFDEISAVLKMDEKAIINALHRVRKKFSKVEDLHSIVDNGSPNRYSILELK
ncbi:sigma-70 family RNA polymerase sigma factor [Jeotgalicoccus meleagridis]|uniref:RNA polymerase factor sigma-70 n=1 Tax=Jeotgalicoccus meleagridis TaxID=2759181 RepID=A0A6V7RBN4_9STAP|nr:sigma-70 family RNA polymerase sigma factor [Jeotgalicoccus meleagridis]CAD2074392.1 RNA polymerase factor sigma-70 [Jeotgalicoccus meleagridis]